MFNGCLINRKILNMAVKKLIFNAKILNINTRGMVKIWTKFACITHKKVEKMIVLNQEQTVLKVTGYNNNLWITYLIL